MLGREAEGEDGSHQNPQTVFSSVLRSLLIMVRLSERPGRSDTCGCTSKERLSGHVVSYLLVCFLFSE